MSNFVYIVQYNAIMKHKNTINKIKKSWGKSLCLLLFCLCCVLYSASLFAQNIVVESGYDGFFARLQVGYAYSELKEDYLDEELSYFGTGPLLTAQLGWALERAYALHLGASFFYPLNTLGPELIETENNPNISITQHSYNLFALALGFSWFHIPTAIYISPAIRVFQNGKRIRKQSLATLTGPDEQELTREEALYSKRVGASLTIGNDRWLGERVGFGIALVLQYDTLLLDKSKTTIISQPSGTEVFSIETDLQRVPVQHFLGGIVLNITFN